MADDPVVKAVSNRFPSRRHGKHPKKSKRREIKGMGGSKVLWNASNGNVVDFISNVWCFIWSYANAK